MAKNIGSYAINFRGKDFTKIDSRITEHQLINFQLLSHIQHKKAILTHLTTDEYYQAKYIALYYKLYAQHFKLINMANLLDKNETYPMESTTHMINETGFIASILLGHWLKQNL